MVNENTDKYINTVHLTIKSLPTKKRCYFRQIGTSEGHFFSGTGTSGQVHQPSALDTQPYDYTLNHFQALLKPFVSLIAWL